MAAAKRFWLRRAVDDEGEALDLLGAIEVEHSCSTQAVAQAGVSVFRDGRVMA